MYGYFFAQTFSGNFQDVQDLVDAGNLGVRFATPCYSGYALFAALEGTNGSDLTAAAGRVVAAGASAWDLAVGTAPSDPASPGAGLKGPPKFDVAQDHEAFVRVQLSSGSSGTFLAAAAGVTDVIGACLTAGAYSALVEVGASSFGAVTTAVTAVAALSGVNSIVTALADL
jgi:hypothetical protein